MIPVRKRCLSCLGAEGAESGAVAAMGTDGWGCDGKGVGRGRPFRGAV